MTSWLSAPHHQLVGVDVEPGDTATFDWESQITGLDDLASEGIVEPQLNLVSGETRTGGQDVSFGTKHRGLPNNSSESNCGGVLVNYVSLEIAIVKVHFVGNEHM